MKNTLDDAKADLVSEFVNITKKIRTDILEINNDRYSEISQTVDNKIVDLAKKSGIKYQLEVESAGGSDGTMLQKTDLPFDWLFIGAPEDFVHTPDEKVFSRSRYTSSSYWLFFIY